MPSLTLGVTDFAVPAPRAGSIEQFSGYGGLPEVGSEIHLEIQAERARTNPGYTAERWLTHAFTHGAQKITVSGRADGFAFGPPALIEEIKTAYFVDDLRRALDRNVHHPYKLQLRTYGYLHQLDYGSEPELQLLLVDARTRARVEYPVALDHAEYEAWLERRLTELTVEQAAFEATVQRRKREAKRFTFPFAEARPGQRELMTKVEENLKPGSRLLVQAPTGLGKTAGVAFPSLREAMARGQKTIYLTPKNSQFEVAEDAVRRLAAVGTKVRALTLHAKAKMCFKEEVLCNPDYCEFAKDHYTKMAARDVVNETARADHLTAEVIKESAARFEVCPFDLQMESVRHVDLVIGDYNYVFSPRSSTARLTFNGHAAQTKRGGPNLIVDEVHNLPARAQDYFSAGLSAAALGEMLTAVPENLRDAADHVNEALAALLARVQDDDQRPRRIELEPEATRPLAARAQELLGRHLASANPLVPADPVVRAANQVSEFTGALEAVGEEFFVTWTPDPARRTNGNLRLTCCDASAWLRENYAGFNAVIGFSATLKPFAYYAQLTGFDGEGLVTAEFETPFPAENRKILVIPQVSTKMRDRARNYAKISGAIERILGVRPGNYFVFFPSFDFLNQVLAQTNLPGFRVIAQTRDLRRDRVNEILNQLREGVPTVVFAVQGGVFAEGVDYPGDVLIGAIIVGPALPSFDFERELLREYYEKKHGRGFDYAYTYPAMARVIQSAGRVIRSGTDRGLIVLMDRRFTEAAYVDAMPRDWLSQGDLRSNAILGDVRAFWARGDAP